MRTVNELVEKLYKEAGHRIVEKQKADPNMYKELMKNLIVQVCILSLIQSKESNMIL